MNQRIRELVVQAGGNFANDPLEFAVVFGELEDFKQFAELIVRECCDVFVELRTRPADLAVKDVKKHFGVRE